MPGTVVREKVDGNGPGKHEPSTIAASPARDERHVVCPLPFVPLFFGFWMETKSRTGYHLLWGSKDFRGYHIPKDIVLKKRSSAHYGVPFLGYNPRDYTSRFGLSRAVPTTVG